MSNTHQKYHSNNNETSVVNVRVSNIRDRDGYQNLKEWCEDENNIYIGRKGVVFIDKQRYPKEDSIWANPFKIDDQNTREKVIHKYRKYIIRKIKKENLWDELQNLKGKKLGCWCHPKLCHGDVLIDLINEYDIDESQTGIKMV